MHIIPYQYKNPFVSTSNSEFPVSYVGKSCSFAKPLRVKCAKKAERSGKLRYPSEKKKLRVQQRNPTNEKIKLEGIWRLSKLGISVHDDPGKDFYGISEPLLKEIAQLLDFPVASMLPTEAFTVIRKAFDARKKEPKFVYTVHMDVQKLLCLEPRTWEFVSELEPKVGRLEFWHSDSVSGNGISTIFRHRNILDGGSSAGARPSGVVEVNKQVAIIKPKVVVVGSGPSGLFAALVLAEVGADVTLVERGQSVEQRGRDIGALVVRQILQLESNFCFGEGGAGTWSDGKLVTRIGRNNDSVTTVLRTLVHFGAPHSILIDGKPHLGTDRLVPLLQGFRLHLQKLGVSIRFGTRVDDLLVQGGCVEGVKISDSRVGGSGYQDLGCDAVVLAVGHSARDTYQMLLSHGVDVIKKDFAVGLRIEHPQELINDIQYSGFASEVQKGRGKVPVADYQVSEYVNPTIMKPIPDLDLTYRSCYSFCMCPGGQVVLTSTDPSEICVNGMSFSRRSSRWANAALVVTVSSKDFEALDFHGPLAGVQFQRMFERKAATMGGGNFVVPVQKVTDFLDHRLSVTNIPPSSYRLGVNAAKLHELFPLEITEALQQAILLFDKELPGFISDRALLHGVETRTSAPIQITRTSDTWESTSLRGLYPIGEGAGFAGGIVSAAVDGLHAGFVVARNLGLYTGDLETILGKAQNTGFAKY